MWVKICGVNDPAIAREIANLRPDAIGLNFYERSVRRVRSDIARQIAESLPEGIDAIGVFVNTSARDVQQTVEDCRLSGFQYHASGDDDPSAEVDRASVGAGRRLKRIRAFQIGPEGLAPLEDYFGRAGERHQADACLVDAYVEGLRGGTGKTVSWQLLRDEYRSEVWPPLILAGGLRPENVAEAIEVARPWGVDVASGVESAPGVKDPKLVARFIEEARRAFSRLNAPA
jgi:phosphoribosylanthranilate isomerase